MRRRRRKDKIVQENKSRKKEQEKHGFNKEGEVEARGQGRKCITE